MVILAIAEVDKNEGNDDFRKKNFSSAIYFYTEGIKVNCRDEELKAKLYSNRATAHFCVGKKIHSFIHSSILVPSFSLSLSLSLSLFLSLSISFVPFYFRYLFSYHFPVREL